MTILSIEEDGDDYIVVKENNLEIGYVERHDGADDADQLFLAKLFALISAFDPDREEHLKILKSMSEASVIDAVGDYGYAIGSDGFRFCSCTHREGAVFVAEKAQKLLQAVGEYKPVSDDAVTSDDRVGSFYVLSFYTDSVCLSLVDTAEHFDRLSKARKCAVDILVRYKESLEFNIEENENDPEYSDHEYCESMANDLSRIDRDIKSMEQAQADDEYFDRTDLETFCVILFRDKKRVADWIKRMYIDMPEGSW